MTPESDEDSSESGDEVDSEDNEDRDEREAEQCEWCVIVYAPSLALIDCYMPLSNLKCSQRCELLYQSNKLLWLIPGLKTDVDILSDDQLIEYCRYVSKFVAMSPVSNHLPAHSLTTASTLPIKMTPDIWQNVPSLTFHTSGKVQYVMKPPVSWSSATVVGTITSPPGSSVLLTWLKTSMLAGSSM